jgi:uncharacterized membrane protein YedE/YeeE
MSSLSHTQENLRLPLKKIQINALPIGLASIVILAGALYIFQTVSLKQAVLWIIGALMGITLYFASFGFTQAWRVFIANGRGAGLRAQMVMLAIGVLLFFPFLASGTLFGNPVNGLVAPAGVSVLLGAFIFGIGMQLGGGCASGTLFAAGGGNTRMFVTLFFFIVGSVIGAYIFPWWSALPAIKPYSMVKEWGLAQALIANLAVFALIAWGTTVLEKRRHGGIEPISYVPNQKASFVHGPWPLVWGAVALVILNFATLALAGRPWGITSAFALWGSQALHVFGVDVATWAFWSKTPQVITDPITKDITSVMDIGIMLGALVAASAAGKFAPIWHLPLRSLMGAMVGGLLLGIGARMAYGCNIGAYFSGIISGSLHAWLWVPAAFAGNALGVYFRPFFGLSVEKTPRLTGC